MALKCDVVQAMCMLILVYLSPRSSKSKTGLVIEIKQAIVRLALTQQVAGKRMGLTQLKVSDMMRGDFTNLSERKLMDCLNCLGCDIEIKVGPVSKSVVHLTSAIA
jgi:predicted XRE-type DNA-binding protein